MKNLFYFLAITVMVVSCGTSNKIINARTDSDIEESVVIENDSLEYKIIIYDIGFSNYLNSIAKPVNFYSQNYYENKNIFYVTSWNIRARNPLQYGDFYGNEIDYQQNIDYGLDVNYKLFNYFKFVEYKYGIRF
ncbi:DUF6146 family protein [Urechidicola croceus]|uniref:Lipoprotein n=1 Tax=Urechidicola croceus TaxID=1850246 RepID=A0A1D8P7H7_9FLAO|nr:DUF6146 family protein [Urechidicola croceus]AOW20520.1 hypothetical protein LPB138_07450 [Urechidicola croceus]